MSSSPPIYVAVVDDDESQCRSLGRLLRASGIQPITYLSAEAFLADRKQPQFDCLLLDVEFNGMSGLELQKHLVASGSHTPVIFVTAHDAPEVRGQALAGGCSAFFRKTESGSVIVETIRRIVD